MSSTQRGVRIHETGDFDVVKFEENIPIPEIADNEVLVKNSYAGVNFIENYFRQGLYPAKFPMTLGREGSGEVVKVGSKVKNLKVGDKIGYLGGGAFAEYTNVDSNKAVVIPDGVSEELAAGILVSGLTSLTLVKEAYKVKKGDYILVYAAAGGAGSILVQLGKHIGAHVIGVVSTDEKAKIARDLGAEFIINHKTEDIAERVKEITNGAGAIGIFDSVGKATWDASFKSIARKGYLVSYGNASGPVPPISLLTLSPKNVTVLRPTLFNYVATEEEWKHYSTELFRLIADGTIKFNISKVYPLSETRKALEDIFSGKTVGKLVVKI